MELTSRLRRVLTLLVAVTIVASLSFIIAQDEVHADDDGYKYQVSMVGDVPESAYMDVFIKRNNTKLFEATNTRDEVNTVYPFSESISYTLQVVLYGVDSLPEDIVFDGYEINGVLIPPVADSTFFSNVQIDNISRLNNSLTKYYEADGYYYLNLRNVRVIGDVTIKIKFHKVIPKKYNLTVNSASPEEMGEVSAQWYNADQYTITATPSSKAYGFKSWNDGDTNPVRTVELTEDTTFTATFEESDFYIDEESAFIGFNSSISNIMNYYMSGDLYEGMQGGFDFGLRTNAELGNMNAKVELTDIDGNSIPLTNDQVTVSGLSVVSGKASHFRVGLKNKDGLFTPKDNKIKVKVTLSGEGFGEKTREAVVTLPDLKKPAELDSAVKYWGLEQDVKDTVEVNDVLAFPDDKEGAKVFLACTDGVYQRKADGSGIEKMDGPFVGSSNANSVITIAGSSIDDMYCLYVSNYGNFKVYHYDGEEWVLAGTGGNVPLNDEEGWQFGGAHQLGDTIVVSVTNRGGSYIWDKENNNWTKLTTIPGGDGNIIKSTYKMDDDTTYVTLASNYTSESVNGLYKYTSSTGEWDKIDIDGLGSNLVISGGCVNGDLAIGVYESVPGTYQQDAHYIYNVKTGKLTKYDDKSGLVNQSGNSFNYNIQEDYKGNVYAFVKQVYQGSDKMNSGYVYKVEDENTWTFLSSSYLNKIDESGNSLFGDDFRGIYNPIDGLSIFAGQRDRRSNNGMHLAMDGTHVYTKAWKDAVAAAEIEIANADALVEDDYTEESFKAVSDAKDALEKLIESDDATAAEIVDGTTALKEAIAGLITKGQAAAMAVDDAIAALPDAADLKLTDRADVEAVRQLYEDLSPEEKALVKKLDTLRLAETTLNVLDLTDKLTAAQTTIGDLNNKITAAEAELQRTEKALNDAIAEGNRSKEEIESLKKQLQESQDRLAAVEKELIDSSLDKIIDAAEKTAESIAETISNTGNSAISNVLKAMLEVTNKSLATVKTELEKVKSALESRSGKIADLEEQLTGVQTQLENAQTELDNANKEIADALEIIGIQKTVIKSVKAKGLKKKARITWKTAGKGYKYEVYVSKKLSKGFKKKATVAKTKAVVKKLKGKTIYYVKVRAFKKVNGKKIYTQYSNTVKVKVKAK